VNLGGWILRCESRRWLFGMEVCTLRCELTGRSSAMVLGAGGDIVDGGEVGEKTLDFFLAGEVWRHALDGVAVALEPINIQVK